jgi:hypothetical protein
MSVKRRSLCAALAVSLAVAATPGCGLLHQGPSAVAQGQYFSTGNPQYDEFFLRLHRMQVELKEAPDALAAARSDAARSVALEPAAKDDALRKALKAKAGDVSARGATLLVDRRREKARLELTVLGTPASADRELVKTFSASVARVGDVREKLDAWKRELEWLPPSAVELDGKVEAAFVGRSRATRNDVHENLADAQKLIALMGERLKEIEATSTGLEELFVSAFGESRHEPPPSPEPSSPPEKPKPRPAPRAEARRNESPQADDAPVASPKPKQGTARPDFEP